MRIFRKQPTTSEPSRRTRQPASTDRSGNQAVFSYHANRSARGDASGSRVTNKLSWMGGGDSTKITPRRSRGFGKRLRSIGVIVVVVGVSGYILTLDRRPEVISLADSDNRQVFLRSHDVYEQAAQTLMASSYANTNKLTIDTATTAERMRRQFPELEHVSVAIPVLGRRPAVYIQPARPSLLLKSTHGGVYVLDASGRALILASQVPKIEKLGLPLVDDQSGLPAVLGQSLLPSDNVAFITEVVGQLKAKKITVASIVLPKEASQLDVRITGAPYAIKFNLQGDARAEVGAYLAVKRHLEREHKTPESYIDVRVDNRAYYR